MCVVSMVYDDFGKRDWGPVWPSPYETKPIQPLVPAPTEPPQDWGKTIALGAELDRLRKLIDEFKEAVAAAKVVDRLTNQPDCEDPEKKALEARVAELEKRLDEVAPRGVKAAPKKQKAKARRKR